MLYQNMSNNMRPCARNGCNNNMRADNSSNNSCGCMSDGQQGSQPCHSQGNQRRGSQDNPNNSCNNQGCSQRGNRPCKNNCNKDQRQPFPPGMPIAMAYVPWQGFEDVYPLENGFHMGTIFPELNLGFRCASPACNCIRPAAGMRGGRI